MRKSVQLLAHMRSASAFSWPRTQCGHCSLTARAAPPGEPEASRVQRASGVRLSLLSARGGAEILRWLPLLDGAATFGAGSGCCSHLKTFDFNLYKHSTNIRCSLAAAAAAARESPLLMSPVATATHRPQLQAARLGSARPAFVCDKI